MYRGREPRFLLENRDLLLLGGLVVLLAAGWYAAGLGGGGSRFPLGQPIDDFYWTQEPGPVDPIAVPDPDTARRAVMDALAVLEDERDELFPVTAVSLFPTAAAAEAFADETRDLVADATRWFDQPVNAAARATLEDPNLPAPLSQPEIDALGAAGMPPGTRGNGWGGVPADADDAIFTVDRLLFAVGFKSADMIETYPPPRTPIERLLVKAGATVLLEGDRFSEGGMVLDASCRPPDAATAQRLADEIDEAILSTQYYAIPPWVEEPTAEQVLARATVRRWADASIRAMNDPRVAALFGQMGRASSAEDLRRLGEELAQILRERGPELLDGPVDAEVLTLLASGSELLPEPSARAARNEQIGALLGAFPLRDVEQGYRFPRLDDYATLMYIGETRVQGDRLELGVLSPVRFSVAGVQLLAYLDDAGCTDLRIRLTDVDEALPD
jgi:hypothetical protein